MDSPEPRPRAVTSFLSLPLELREVIYILALAAPQRVIRIRSPKSKTGNREQCEARGAVYKEPELRRSALMLANKEINAQVVRYLYASYTVAASNGTFGARDQANLHGLRAFVRRVPRDLIACITKMCLGALLDDANWYANDETSDWDQEWADEYDEERPGTEEQNEFRSVAKLAASKFPVLLSVTIVLLHDRHVPRREMLRDSYNVQFIAGIVRRLLKRKDIKEIGLMGVENPLPLRPDLYYPRAPNVLPQPPHPQSPELAAAIAEESRVARLVRAVVLKRRPEAAEVVKVCVSEGKKRVAARARVAYRAHEAARVAANLAAAARPLATLRPA